MSSKKSPYFVFFDRWLDFFSLFFPHYCIYCSRGLVKGEDILCAFCLSDLPYTRYSYQLNNPIMEKLYNSLAPQQAMSLLSYKKKGIAQQLIHDFKYKNHHQIGRIMGQLIGEELKKAQWPTRDLIIPVPLHKHRLRKRGYNQSAILAKGIGRVIDAQVDETILHRVHSTETQTQKRLLARWKNVEGAFVIQDTSKVVHKDILLVDDVITTGSTLVSCGQLLRSAGCSSLHIACLAETN